MSDRIDVRAQTILVGALLVGVGALQTSTRYLRIMFGGAEWEPNFANVWRPLAEELHDGGSLYLNGMGDNKPPLFEMLNFALGEFPNYGLIFLLLTGMANGIVALLLWKLISTEYGDWYGLLAAGIWLLTLPHVNGTHINVRSFALVGLLSALLVDRALWRGIAIGVAGLFSQYAVLFVPILAWDSIRKLDVKNRMRWLFSFGSGGAVTLVVSFGIVGLLWGPRAILAGLNWSYGIPTGVTTTGFATAPGSYVTQPWILTNTPQWGGYILHAGGLLSPIILVFAIRGWWILNKREWSVFFYGGLVLLLPLLIRSYRPYWLLAWPLLILLSVVELNERLQSDDSLLSP